MGFLNETVEIPRRTMILFFLVDTSGSMYGDKIGAVNEAILESVPDIKDLSEANADAQIKIAALSFSSGAEWLYDQPIDSESFHWNYLKAEGTTDLGFALTMLKDKLSKDQFMQEATGSFAPVIILLSDGAPTDDYKTALDEIKKNNWFKAGIKIAIAIGKDADKQILQEFTGTSETVIEVHAKSTLKKLIRFVSVRASQVNSKSSGVGESKEQEIIDGIGEFVEQENLNDVEDGW